MKVYIVNALTAAPYEQYRWVHKVFYRKEDAQAYISEFGSHILEQDLQDGDWGYIVSGSIEEHEVT